MDEIKTLAREIVKPLMRNFLELDLKGTSSSIATTTTTEPGGNRPGNASTGVPGGLPYLTCTKVEDEDIPWN